MLEQDKKQEKVVKLGEGVLVRTKLKDAYIPALRSGFAGYPVNPRWSGVKISAWKTGQQWRQAVSRGEMVVRASDSMLVAIEEIIEVNEDGSSQQWDRHSTQSIFESYRLKLPQLTH
jgi:SRSO17 transposase